MTDTRTPQAEVLIPSAALEATAQLLEYVALILEIDRDAETEHIRRFREWVEDHPAKDFPHEQMYADKTPLIDDARRIAAMLRRYRDGPMSRST